MRDLSHINKCGNDNPAFQTKQNELCITADTYFQFPQKECFILKTKCDIQYIIRHSIKFNYLVVSLNTYVSMDKHSIVDSISE